MAEYDDLNTPVIAVIGFIGAILVVAIIMGLMVLYHYADRRETYAKDISQPPIELGNVTAEQQANLTRYRWVDQEKQIVAIPISRAMELVVQETHK